LPSSRFLVNLLPSSRFDPALVAPPLASLLAPSLYLLRRCSIRSYRGYRTSAEIPEMRYLHQSRDCVIPQNRLSYEAYGRSGEGLSFVREHLVQGSFSLMSHFSSVLTYGREAIQRVGLTKVPHLRCIQAHQAHQAHLNRKEGSGSN